jgi:membrane protease YdiL (CAAX protease family)
MQTSLNPSNTIPARRALLITAWGVTLFVSILPVILFREIGGSEPGWLFWARVGLPAVVCAATFFWPAIKPLRQYFLVIVLLDLSEYLFAWVGGTALWKSWFDGPQVSFITSMLGTQLLRIAVAFTMILVMLVIKKKSSAFCLVRGDINAISAPVRWLGINEPGSWKTFGGIFALCISLGTLAFLVIAGRPSLTALAGALPLIPMVVLFALMNSFSEEFNYRATFLSTLEEPVGRYHSLLLTAFYFGIGHFYGVPYGVVGVILASFLGWLLGKSMLETRGFFWPWFIHFLQDVLIFSFMAIGSVTAGGK